ncbi:3-deoxy-manno-octulosonate cytidylyltransferase [bacterium]|nr:3-deoxy-manno-octulosonate cytidylyltransferase [bacterium]
MPLTAIGVIPARYASSRFPGKPLAMIAGKPMIQWVYERALRAAHISKLFVATDDERIQQAVHAFGGLVIMTSPECRSGTDRVYEAVRDIECDIVVNIQGDEPFIYPKMIDLAAEILIQDPDARMGTLIKRIFRAEDLSNANVTKVVVNQQGHALYFSRLPVPFYRDETDPAEQIKNRCYYKHVGIYSYRKNFLKQMVQWPQTLLESAEKLEQLRALDHGARIKVAETDSETLGVDTMEDLERARQLAASGLFNP